MVYAQTEEDVSVEILSLHQNVNGEKVDLVLDEARWELQSLNKIEVKYNIEGLSQDGELLIIRIYSSPYRIHLHETTLITNGENSLSFIPDATFWDVNYEYTIYRINEDGYHSLVATGLIQTNYEDYRNFLYSDPGLEITGISQGGNEVSKVGDEYLVNDQQNIEIKYKGENFIESFNYNVKVVFNHSENFVDQNLTKEEMEQEQTLVIKTNGNYWPEDNTIKLIWGIVTDDGVSEVAYKTLDLKVYEDDSLIDFHFDVAYKNFDDKITNIHGWGEDIAPYYRFDIRKYNADNPLIINITGNEFLNQDYEVKFSVYDGETRKEVYNNIYNANGNNLNDTYSIILDYFVPTWSDSPHYFDIEISSTTKTAEFDYRDIGTIDSEFYYANGMKNNIDGIGGGSNHYINSSYTISLAAYDEENPIKIVFKGYNFDKNTTYTYKVTYTMEETDVNGEHISNIVNYGSFIGKNFNNNGLTQYVQFQDKDILSVNLEVFLDDNFVYGNGVGFIYTNHQMLANIQLKSSAKNIIKENKNGLSDYVTTNTEPLEIQINGFGFKDDETYNYTIFAINPEKEKIYDGSEVTGTLNGSDINNRIALINYDKMLNRSHDYMIVLVFDETDASGTIRLEIVKSKEYLENGNSYSVDNVDGFIKGTFYEKNHNTILDEINLKNNYTTKIFTKDGIEASGIVATGMIARIYDSNEDAVLDIPIAIKGDITGTGNITLTDTVKMKRAVAGLETPTGVYASASDINDDGKITLTDAIKVTRHFAGIEVIK